MQQFINAEKPTWNKKYIIAAVILLVLAAALAIFFAMQKPNDTVKEAGSSAAERKFYSALGGAAKQQKLRVGMYRETFANKADADARKNVGTIASSVSEVDTTAGKYRSVFAHNLLEQDGKFSVGRCIDGTTYNDVYESPATNTQRASSLQEATSHLRPLPEGNLYKVTQALVFIPCPHLGLLPATPPLAVSRLSDGVFPVTLSDKQAENWTKKAETAKLFDIKDEGLVERNGANLRKLSFTAKKDDFTVNQKLYNIFYETGEIAKIKSDQPKAEIDYEFQSINPVNSGGISGYYLIDEAKNLPVYSELYGTNPDRKSGGASADARNIARTKQTYAYPTQLTIDLNTPLELLE